MKNIYNNEKFFESYSQMTRSQQGLDGAGEWQTLKRLLPDFKKKRVLRLWLALSLRSRTRRSFSHWC